MGSAGMGSGGKLLFRTELSGKASPPDGDGWAEAWRSTHDHLLPEQQSSQKELQAKPTGGRHQRLMQSNPGQTSTAKIRK